MSYMNRCHWLIIAFSLSCLAACGDGSAGSDADTTPDAGPDAAIAPALYTPRNDLTNNELATQVLTLLGEPSFGGTPNCNDCHGLTRQKLRNWGALSDTSLTTCLTDLAVTTSQSAQQMLDCLRVDPADPMSAFIPSTVGIFSSAAHLAWFEFTFEKAYGANYLTQYNEFLARVGMPRGGQHPLYTQPELDIVATWFTLGLPSLDNLLPPDPQPTTCTPGVSAAVTSHVAAMSTTGWRAVNTQNNLLMHGCNGAPTVFDCLSTYPRAGDQPFSQGWEVNVTGAKLRILRQNAFRSAYWTRSSADGRFVGHGVRGGGTKVIDLQRDFAISGSASYDPGFFPDNSGFMFQGGSAYLCDQSLLESQPASINYDTAAECSTAFNIGLYQHMGAALGGGDYWSSHGSWVADDGGQSVTLSNPLASFGSGSEASLTPIIHNGSTYQAQTSIRVATPYEGDAVISPSAKMVISRLAGASDNQLGFVMREMIAVPNGGSYSIELPEVARYCFDGGKPGFSYDERWLVLHHYIVDADAVDLGFTGTGDPAFAPYRQNGAANIYLIDTLTGNVTRITHMKAGQYALFPHFRADGWIYFMVRTPGTSSEYIVASDAALRLE